VPHSAELLGRYGSDAGLLMRGGRSGPWTLRERPPASRSNPHADDFDPAPADDHAVDGRRREPSVDQLDQQLGLEPVGQHDRLGAAVDGCLKQFERSTALLVRRGHRSWPTHRSAGWHSDAGLAPRPVRSSGGGSGLDTTRCAGPLIALCPIRHYPKNSSTAVKPDAKLLGFPERPTPVLFRSRYLGNCAEAEGAVAEFMSIPEGLCRSAGHRLGT